MKHIELHNRTHIEKLLLTSWSFLTLLFTILGNSFVLYATIRHSAIKLDKLSVWIIQNLAVADLANGVINLLPVLFNTAMGNYWALGIPLCMFNAYTHEAPMIANAYFINMLQCNKIYRCLFPLRSLEVTKRQKLISTTIVGVASLALYNIHVMVGGKILYLYIETVSLCDKKLVHEDTQIHGGEVTFLGFPLACAGLVISTVILICIAVSRSHRTINKTGIMCFVLMTLMFIVSYLPLFLCIIDIMPYSMGSFVLCLASLQSYTNPFIYYLSNPRFREFSNRTMRKWKNVAKYVFFKNLMIVINHPQIEQISSA